MGKHPDMTNGIVISGGEYADGRYLVSERFRKYVFPKCKGNVFTDEMYTNADKVVILGNDLGITGEYVTYGDEEYKVTARYGGTDPDMILFPYTSIPVETMFSKNILLLTSLSTSRPPIWAVFSSSNTKLHLRIPEKKRNLSMSSVAETATLKSSAQKQSFHRRYCNSSQ